MSPSKEHRRSPRILATVPLVIHSSGESLEVVTAVINIHGALILSPVNWVEGTILLIDSKKTGLRVRGRVVWSGSKEPTGFHKLGVEFDSAAPDFWGEQYDPQSENVPHPTT
ncbi:MAG: PilZ domain-containing protein [Candidatus Acidiferrales bacterium]